MGKLIQCARARASGNRSVNFIVYFIYLILAMMIFRGTGLAGMFSKTDQDLPFYPIETFNTRSFAWVDTIFFGTSGAEWDIPNTWPTNIFFYVLNIFGLPSGVALRIFFVLIFASLGWGMYFLMSSVIIANFNHNSGRRIGAFTAGLFYMFNPYTFFKLDVHSFDYLMALSFLPLFVGFYIHGKRAYMKSDKRYLKYVVILGIVSTILFTTNYAITYALIFFLMWFFIFESMIVLASKKGRQDLKNFVVYPVHCLIVVVLLNLWWIPNFAWSLYETKGFSSVLSSEEAWIVLRFISNIGMIDALRVQPCFLGTNIYPRFPFNPHWDTIFSSPLMAIIGICILLVAFGCLIDKRSRNKYTIFWAATFLLFIPFYTGLNPPLGSMFLWLWNNVPLFRIFRNPDKFMTIILPSLSILLGISTGLMYTQICKVNAFAHHSKLKKPKKLLFCLPLLLLLFMIFANSYPLLSGDLEGDLEPFNIPKYYDESKYWLDAQTEPYRIMIMPFDSILEAYAWGPKYDTLPMPYKIYKQPIVFYHPREKAVGLSEGTVQLSLFTHNHVESGGKNLAELLSLMNVKYVLLRDDLIQRLPTFEYRDGWWYEIGRENIDISKYKIILENQSHIRKVAEFGSLSFYENEINTPLIYSAKKSIYSTDSLDEVLSTLLELPDINVSDSVILSSEYLLEEEIIPLEGITHVIHAERVASKKWKVEIPDQGTYAIFGKKFGINEENWFSLVGTHDDWEQYVSGGSHGILSVTDGGINLSANEDWYIYWRDVEYSVNDLRYLTVDCRSTGIWYVWIDWFDTEGVDHRTPISFSKSESGFLKTMDLFLYLTETSGKTPQTIHHIELNPDPATGVYIDNMVISQKKPELEKLGIQNFSKGNNMVSSDDELFDLIAARIIERKNPTLQFEKKSPVEYVVNVSESSEPFFLIFSNTFSKSWKAYYGDANWLDALLRKPIPEENHFLVNGFANGWYINETEDFIITLYFWPQTLFYIGSGISITTLIICILCISKSKIKTLYHCFKKKKREV